MSAATLRRIAADLRHAIAEEPDIEAISLAARRLEARAEMIEVGCTEDAGA